MAFQRDLKLNFKTHRSLEFFSLQNERIQKQEIESFPKNKSDKGRTYTNFVCVLNSKAKKRASAHLHTLKN